MRLKSSVGVVLMGCWLGAAGPARAQLALTKIADGSTPVPGAPGTTFKNINNPVLHQGQVAFYSVSSAGVAGLFLFNGSSILKIADTNTAAPDGGNFTNLSFFAHTVENGAVAFAASDTNGQAIFRWTNGVTTRLVKAGDAIPGTATNKFTTFGTPTLDNGVIYFIGSDSTNYRGVHRYDTVVSTGLISSLENFPGSPLTHGFSSQLAVENGAVAVFSFASNSQPNAIFTWTNNVKGFLVSSNDAIPAGSSNFYTFQSPPDFSAGQVAFLGGSVANFQEGLFLRPFAGGAITPVVRRGSANAGLSGTLTGFNGFALDHGEAWFNASGTGGESLFRWQSGSYGRVLSGGMKIGARTISSSGGFTLVPGGADGGALAFVAKFTDTTSGLYVTTNVPPVTNSFTLALTNIVSTNTLLPGGSGNVTFAGSALLWRGGVVFNASGTNNQGGIYRWSNGALSVVINRAMLYPGTATNIFSYAVYASDDTRLLIGLSTQDGRAGVFSYDGTTLTPLVDTTTAIPGGSYGNFTAINIARINGSKVTFFGNGTNSYSGLFEQDGGTITRLVDTSTPFPGTANPLRILNFAQQGGLIGLTAWDGAGTYGALLFTNGTLSLIATNNAVIPAHPNRVFGLFSSPGFFGGQFHFAAQALSTVDAYSGTYLMRANADGSGLAVLVDENTFLPGLPGGVSSVSYFCELSGVFISAVNGSQRVLYHWNSGVAEPLFDNSAPLEGASILSVTPVNGSLSTNGVAIAAGSLAGSLIYFSPPAPAAPAVAGQIAPGSLAYSPGGTFCFSFGGAVPGQSYRIQYNTAPGSTNWVTLTNLTYAAPITICDDGATNQGRIYRAVSP